MASEGGVRAWSLKRTLPLISIVTSSAALLLACGTFLVYDWTSTRREAERELDALTVMLTEQTAVSLMFRDPKTAQGILGSLSRTRDISRAVLYDGRSEPFTSYVRAGTPAPEARPGPDGIRETEGRLVVARPVLDQNRRIGTLVLESTMESARRRLNLGILVTLGVLAASSVLAFFLAVRLARPIATPVLALARAMERVTREHRYDRIAAIPASGGEIRQLVTGFDEMLHALKEREIALDRLAQILEGTPDFVGMSNLQEQVLYLNAAGRKLMAIPDSQDISLMKIEHFLSPEMYARLAELAIPAAIREGAWRGESELRSLDGRVIPVSQVIMVHRTPEGQPAYLSTIVRDLTDIKKAQETVLRNEEQMRTVQKMEALGRLAGGVAHDFNNLLTVIGGYAHLLGPAFPAGDPRAGQVREIAGAVDRAGALTRQLLAFSRRQIAEVRVLDLNEVVRNSEKMLRRLIGEHIQMTARLHPRPVLVKADPGQMDQVLMNLVVNARDAVAKGGTIEISTSEAELDGAGAASLSLPSGGAHAALTVTDTGCGMDAETLAHVFEPFFTTKELGRGTGLGLSTVYGIVRQSGGGIKVLSRPGEGTQISIYLPATKEAADPLPLPEAPARQAGGRETLLLVEDERSVREFIRQSLEQEGYRVLVAAEPAEALRIFRSHPDGIDLVVTDVIMPNLSGPELAARLRERTPDLRVLFVSGYPEDELKAQALNAPGTGFLAKPFAPADLSAAVRKLLDPISSRRKAEGEEPR